MRAVVQRVGEASVLIAGSEYAAIGRGLLILLGVENGDDEADVDWLAGKISRMRLFADVSGKMNLDVQEVKGDVMVISQFTLHASTKKGNRPSFMRAADPEIAEELYKSFIREIGEVTGRIVQSGSFGAMMDVRLINSGPVTIIVDSKNKE